MPPLAVAAAAAAAAAATANAAAAAVAARPLERQRRLSRAAAVAVLLLAVALGSAAAVWRKAADAAASEGSNAVGAGQEAVAHFVDRHWGFSRVGSRLLRLVPPPTQPPSSSSPQAAARHGGGNDNNQRGVRRILVSSRRQDLEFLNAVDEGNLWVDLWAHRSITDAGPRVHLRVWTDVLFFHPSPAAAAAGVTAGRPEAAGAAWRQRRPWPLSGLRARSPTRRPKLLLHEAVLDMPRGVSTFGCKAKWQWAVYMEEAPSGGDGGGGSAASNAGSGGDATAAAGEGADGSGEAGADEAAADAADVREDGAAAGGGVGDGRAGQVRRAGPRFRVLEVFCPWPPRGLFMPRGPPTPVDARSPLQGAITGWARCVFYSMLLAACVGQVLLLLACIVMLLIQVAAQQRAPVLQFMQ